MLHALDSVPVPVIGRIHGAALGGGAGLAAVCDVVVAADDALFGFTEVDARHLPAMISPYVVRKIGLSAARELCLTGARFSAARAKEIGLVHEVVPPSGARLTRRPARRSCSARPRPRRSPPTKRILRDVDGRRPARRDGADGRRDRRQRVSPEGQEGLRAFLEKRRPAWDRRHRRPITDAARPHRQSRRDRPSRHPHLPRDGPRDGGGLLGGRRRRAARGRGGRRPCHRAAAGSESYLNIAARHRGGAPRRARTRSIPATGSCRRTPAFAEACADAGLTFVGPPAAVIATNGIEDRGTRDRAAPPACRSCPATCRRRRTTRTSPRAVDARRISRPCSRPPRRRRQGHAHRAQAPDDLAEAIGAARREAERAFGDGTLYVERLDRAGAAHRSADLRRPHGHVVHLFERDCSLQRRHQKVIEEAPAPVARAGGARSADARRAGCGARGRLRQRRHRRVSARGRGRRGAVLFPGDEHAPAGRASGHRSGHGLRLVRAQLLVAAGEPLPFTQADVALDGHAIECRIYAEDSRATAAAVRPAAAVSRAARATGIRVDSGVREGQTITVHYDPLLAKLIAHGATRAQAHRARLDRRCAPIRDSRRAAQHRVSARAARTRRDA